MPTCLRRLALIALLTSPGPGWALPAPEPRPAHSAVPGPGRFLQPDLIRAMRTYPVRVIKALPSQPCEGLWRQAGNLFGEGAPARALPGGYFQAQGAMPSHIGPRAKEDIAQRRAYVGRLKKVAALSLVMAGVEIGASVRTESGSLWADALHLLVDGSVVLGTLASNVLALRHPEWSAETEKAIDAGVGLASAAVIVGMAGHAAIQAVGRLYTPQPVMGWATLLAACAGFAGNAGSFYLLYDPRQAGQSVKTAWIHAGLDALGSLGIIAASALQLWGGWDLADPVIALGIVGLIFFTAIPRVLDSGRVLWRASEWRGRKRAGAGR